jgi:hypothetical protein
VATAFPKFAKELLAHAAPGYHRRDGVIGQADAVRWFETRGIHPPNAYLEFLATIGPGRYFAGSLELFAPAPAGSRIDTWTGELPSDVRERLFIFGYGGTTEGDFCLSRTGADDAVYWHSCETGEVEREHDDFVRWIESQPRKLFRESSYAAYRPVRDPAGIAAVVRERSLFRVRLVEFDRKLARPPGHEKDLLSRYHRLRVAVRKAEASALERLTMRVRRLGSRVGADNVTHVALDVAAVPVGVETVVTAWAFDPFNVAFESLEIEFEPEIDLRSPSRTCFVEIRDYV